MCNIRIEIARIYLSICKTILTFACNSQVLASNRKCWQAVRKHSQCVLKKMSTNRNRFSLFVMDSQAFATFYLQKMLANPYECLTITTNALPSIRIYCDAYENNKNMLS